MSEKQVAESRFSKKSIWCLIYSSKNEFAIPYTEKRFIMVLKFFSGQHDTVNIIWTTFVWKRKSWSLYQSLTSRSWAFALQQMYRYIHTHRLSDEQQIRSHVIISIADWKITFYSVWLMTFYSPQLQLTTFQSIIISFRHEVHDKIMSSWMFPCT